MLKIAMLAFATGSASLLGLGAWTVHEHGGLHGHRFGAFRAEMVHKFIDFAVSEKLDEIDATAEQRQKVQEVDDIVPKSKAAVARRQASSPPTPSPKLAPKRPDDQLNVVLDKISEHGLDSLTSDERRILEEMSRKLKDRD